MAGADTDWNKLAELPGVTGVLDPRDGTGAKNRLIDSVHKRALWRHLGPMEAVRALDFGCGQGRMAELLVAAGAIVDGVDAAPGMVAAARNRVPRGRFEVIDPENFSLTHGAYDLVLSVCVLQYVAPDPPTLDATLAELGRALVLGGRLLAIERVDDGSDEIGGPALRYEAAIERAGLDLRAFEFVRARDSRVLRLVQRFPALAELRPVSWLYERASNETSPGHPQIGSYAEYLFAAVRR